jgi:hypothetical protein
VESHTLAFEDIHAVAVRLAARRLSDLQNRVADREARKLSHPVRAQRAEVQLQLQRIAFLVELVDRTFAFDMHEINLWMIEEEMVVKSSHVKTVVECS